MTPSATPWHDLHLEDEVAAPGEDSPVDHRRAEAVARTLDSLADRVRNGELELPSWMDGRGEAATLAGLLAVLVTPPCDAGVDRRHGEGVAGGEARS